MSLAFDHMAIAARTLDEGAAWLAGHGLTLEPGGRHPGMGTHNRLMSLGPGEYLELIAPDPEADVRPCWFGLDGFDSPPRVAGWVMRATPLRAPAGTRVVQARRGDLSWQITLPLAGQMPRDGAQPMLIDWGDGPHPSDRLPDRGVRLTTVTERIGEIDGQNQSVATATEEQTAVVETLNLDISEINLLNQQGVSNLEATLSACTALEQEAARLQQLVGGFRI